MQHAFGIPLSEISVYAGQVFCEEHMLVADYDVSVNKGRDVLNILVKNTSGYAMLDEQMGAQLKAFARENGFYFRGEHGVHLPSSLQPWISRSGKQDAAGFSRDLCATGDFSFSNEGKTISRSGSSQFRTALVDWPVSAESASTQGGVVSWNITLDTMNPENNVFVGLACLSGSQFEHHKLFQTYLGETKTVFNLGFHSKSKKLYYFTEGSTNSTSKDYGQIYSQGDVITTTVDFNIDTVSFAVNGVDQGVAHTGGFGSDQVWYPAVSLYTNRDAVTFSCTESGASLFVNDAELETIRKEIDSAPYKISHRKMPSSGALNHSECVLDRPSLVDSLVTEVELCFGEPVCEDGAVLHLHAYVLVNNAAETTSGGDLDQTFKRVAVREFSIDPAKCGVAGKPDDSSKYQPQRILISPPLPIGKGTYLGVCTSAGKLNLVAHTEGRGVGEAIFTPTTEAMIPRVVGGEIRLRRSEPIGQSVWLKFHCSPAGYESVGLLEYIVPNQIDSSKGSSGGEGKKEPISTTGNSSSMASTSYVGLTVGSALEKQQERKVLLVVQCWGRVHVIPGVSSSTTTNEVKALISERIGISGDKQTLYIFPGISSTEEIASGGDAMVSRLDEHPRVLSRVRYLGFTGIASILCIVSRADYQASRLFASAGGTNGNSAEDSNTSQQRRRKAKLPASAAHRLLLFMTSSPFRSEEVALSWNSCFRLMYKFYDARELLASQSFFHNFNQVLRAALVAPRNLSAVVETDLLRVLSLLFSVRESSGDGSGAGDEGRGDEQSLVELRRCVTSAAVDTFTIASRLNGLLYGQILAVVRENIAKSGSWRGIEAVQLGALLIDVSQAVTTEAGDATSVSGNELHVMCEAIRYINTTLECAFRISLNDGANKGASNAGPDDGGSKRRLRLDLLRQIMGLSSTNSVSYGIGKTSSIAAQRLLEWMSTANLHDDQVIGALRGRLGDELVEMFRFVVTLSAEEGHLEASEVRAFIDLLFKVLRMGPSDRGAGSTSRILAVALNAVRANEGNAMHFAKTMLNAAVPSASPSGTSSTLVNAAAFMPSVSVAPFGGRMSSISRAITKVLSPRGYSSTSLSIGTVGGATYKSKPSNGNIAPRCRVLSVCTKTVIGKDAMQVLRLLKGDTNSSSSSSSSSTSSNSQTTTASKLANSMVIRWDGSEGKSSSTGSGNNSSSKWETVIVLPEDAVVRYVEVSCLKDTKLSKISGAIGAKGERTVLPAKVDILVGASESRFRLVGTSSFVESRKGKNKTTSSGTSERVSIEAMGHAAVRFLKIVIHKSARPPASAVVSPTSPTTLSSFSSSFSSSSSPAAMFSGEIAQTSLLSNICIKATTLSGSFHQNHSISAAAAPLSSTISQKWQIGAHGDYAVFADVLAMQVLYEAFHTFASIPRALATSSESFAFSDALPEQVIQLLVPIIADQSTGSYASMILAMAASTNPRFLRRIVSFIFGTTAAGDNNPITQQSGAHASLAGKLCSLDSEALLIMWSSVAKSLSMLYESGASSASGAHGHNSSSCQKLMPFLVSLAAALGERSKRGMLPSSSTFRQALGTPSSVGVAPKSGQDALSVHVGMLIDLAIQFNVASVNPIDKVPLWNDLRAIGREEMALYAAPRSLLCALVRVSKDLCSVVMQTLLQQASVESQQETSSAGESKNAGRGKTHYHPGVVPIVGMLIGAHEPLLGFHAAWVQTAADALLSYLKSMNSESHTAEALDEIRSLLDMFAGIVHCGAGKRFVGGNTGLLDAVIKTLSTISIVKGSDYDRELQHIPHLSECLLVSGTHFVRAAWNLSLENQKIATTALIDSLSELSQLNTFVRQLLVSSFTMSENVHVSVERHFGKILEMEHISHGLEDRNLQWINESSVLGLHLSTAPVASSLGPTVKVLFGNNSEDTSNNIAVFTGLPKEFTFEGTRLKYATGLGHSYRTAIARDAFVSGVHEWQVTLESCNSASGQGNQLRDTFVGISNTKKISASQYCGSNNNSWGYYASNGYGYHNTSKAYGKAYRIGDTVSVRLDCDAGTLSFSVNGDDQGVAYENLNCKEYFPAVALYYPGDTVSVVYLGGDKNGGGSIEMPSVAARRNGGTQSPSSSVWPPLAHSLFSSSLASMTSRSVLIDVFRTSLVQCCPIDQRMAELMCACGALGADWHVRSPGDSHNASVLHRINPLMSLRETSALSGNQEVMDLGYEFRDTTNKWLWLRPGSYEWHGRLESRSDSKVAGLAFQVTIKLRVAPTKRYSIKELLKINKGKTSGEKICTGGNGSMKFSLADIPTNPSHGSSSSTNNKTSKHMKTHNLLKLLNKSIVFQFDCTFVDSECREITSSRSSVAPTRHLLLNLLATSDAVRKAVKKRSGSVSTSKTMLSRIILDHVGRSFHFACSSGADPIVIAGSARGAEDVELGLREPAFFGVSVEYSEKHSAGLPCWAKVDGHVAESSAVAQANDSKEASETVVLAAANKDSSHTSPMLLKIAEMGGLSTLLALVKGQIIAESTGASADATNIGTTNADSSKNDGGGKSAKKGKPIGRRHRYEMMSKSGGEMGFPSVQELKYEKRVKREKQQMWRWLSALEGNIALPGFAEAFMTDRQCVVLLLKALGVNESSRGGSMSRSAAAAEAAAAAASGAASINNDESAAMKKLLSDPLGSQVSALTALFKKQKENWQQADPKMLKTCLESGVLDRLLLRVGELQGEEPRDPTWTEKYEDPIVVRARREKKAKSKMALEKAAAAAIAEANGEGKESGALWRPGYGHGNGSSTTADADREKRVAQRLKSTILSLECFAAFLEIPNAHADAVLSIEDWAMYVTIVDASPVLKVFMSYLFGNSTSSVLDKPELYSSILRCIIALASHPQLVKLLMKRPGLYKSMEELMLENKDLVEELEDEDDEDDGACTAEKKSLGRLRAEAQVKKLFKLSIAKVDEGVSAQLKLQREEAAKRVSDSASNDIVSKGGGGWRGRVKEHEWRPGWRG